MSQAIESPPRIIAPEIPDDSITTVAAPAPVPVRIPQPGDDTLFNRCAWLYVLFRDKLFRDDTDRMINALWPNGAGPAAGTRMIEFGCGPGFYSCGFAARFPQMSVLGIDRAPRQLDCAKRKARRLGLTNCRFENDDVLDLAHADESFDLLIAARLLTVLQNSKRAVAEMYRVLRPGGRCLVAEPRYAAWASLPLLAMWLVARMTRIDNGCCEPTRAIVLPPNEFKNLFASQPWRNVKVWQDGRYQYALCEKI